MNTENVDQREDSVNRNPADAIKMRVADAIDRFLEERAEKVAILAQQRQLQRKRRRLKPSDRAPRRFTT
jgi:hypothetical protein